MWVQEEVAVVLAENRLVSWSIQKNEHQILLTDTKSNVNHTVNRVTSSKENDVA